MARSSYIYVVFGGETHILLGAFTVRHEMERWATHYPSTAYYKRYRDGSPATQDIRLELVTKNG
jgi:hypothetical protein